MTTKQSISARELTLDILMEILEHGAPSHVVLNQALSKYQYLDKQDRAFITRATEGTLEYQLQIDYVIDRYSRTKLQRMKPLIRTLLRMSVYQILYMDRVPDSAVCNEAVKLAAKRRFEGLRGFVNGILRTVVREKDRYRPGREGTGDDPWPDDSVRYSMPQWLIELWTESLGTDAARRMLQAFLTESPFSVRCNPDRASREEIEESLRLDGVTVVENAYAEDMLYLENLDYPERLTAFQTGLITVQDLGSACVAKAAGLKAGDTVLDVCGAPGGKSLHAASILQSLYRSGNGRSADDGCGAGDGSGEQEKAVSCSVDRSGKQESAVSCSVDRSGKQEGAVSCSVDRSGKQESAVSCSVDRSGRQEGAAPCGGAVSGRPEDAPGLGHVYVRDISGRKAGMILENVRRCGYEDRITVQVWDALVIDEGMEGKADVVFADLPCSGLGVIGRKPDIKHRVRPEDIGALEALQREILSVVWRYVKPGGTLVYSTCTVSPRENTGNRDWFLANYPFEPVDITGRLGDKIRAASMAEGYLQLLPGEYPCDGFFLAVMRRKKQTVTADTE